MLSVHVHIYAYKTHCYNSGSATKPCHNVFLHVIAECMSMNVKEVTIPTLTSTNTVEGGLAMWWGGGRISVVHWRKNRCVCMCVLYACVVVCVLTCVWCVHLWWCVCIVRMCNGVWVCMCERWCMSGECSFVWTYSRLSNNNWRWVSQPYPLMVSAHSKTGIHKV